MGKFTADVNFCERPEMNALGDKVKTFEIKELRAHRILKHWLLVELYY